MIISIKHAVTESDWQQVKNRLHELLAFEKALRPQRKDPDSTINGAFRYVRENIAQHQGTCLVAVNEEGIVLGFMTGWVDGGDGLDKHSRTGAISDAYVAPPYRNRSLFKGMLAEMARHFAVIGGLQRLTLDTLGTNRNMQTVLSRSGFSQHKIYYEISL